MRISREEDNKKMKKLILNTTLLMTMHQILRRRMSMVRADFTVGFSCKRATVKFQRRSSLSLLLEDVIIFMTLHITLLSAFSTIRISGSILILAEDSMRSTSTFKTTRLASGSML